MIIGWSGSPARRRSMVLLPVVLLTVVLGPPTGGPAAAADGAGPGRPALQVNVNGRPGLGALRPGIRTGAAVVKTYRLTNRGGADLYALRIHDPTLPGARIRCPGGRDHVPLLTGLRSVTCTARATARRGTWIGYVLAVGRQPHLRATVRARALSGYAGVGAHLTLRGTARGAGPGRARVRYTVINTGNRPAYRIRLGDPALGPARIVCPSGGRVVARLAPGAAVTCRADARRAAGTYVSRAGADGSDLLRTLAPDGGTTAPPRLVARATARFTFPAPTPPAAPAPRSPATAPAPRPPGGPGLPAPPPTAAEPPPAALLLPTPPPPPRIAAPDRTAPRTQPPPPESAAAPATPRPPERPRQQRPQEQHRQEQHRQEQHRQKQRSALRAFVREDHSPATLGVASVLLLLLIPAAVAAAVLGSRRS
ncbi:hypothetical protein [Streptomyces sp. Da 82-17]|uniref:hypothetical protein n=1 Tax=Streptomyces sp. Da 82-17 TaxID=3377116 RepID=UPI0038D48532